MGSIQIDGVNFLQCRSAKYYMWARFYVEELTLDGDVPSDIQMARHYQIRAAEFSRKARVFMGLK